MEIGALKYYCKYYITEIFWGYVVIVLFPLLFEENQLNRGEVKSSRGNNQTSSIRKLLPSIIENFITVHKNLTHKPKYQPTNTKSI